jgi:flavodoxin
MKVVIVYESMYGNTHRIADAIGDGLEAEAEVTVVPVEDAGAELVRAADLRRRRSPRRLSR